MWQNFSSFAHQVVRLYVNTDHVELEYTIGPIPIQYVASHLLVVECVTIGIRKVKKLSVAMTLIW